MKLIECIKCRSNELFEENGYVVCAYCRLRFIANPDDLPTPSTVISVFDDVQQLLSRCRAEPGNSRRLASLVLDIDPTNQEAQHYLR